MVNQQNIVRIIIVSVLLIFPMLMVIPSPAYAGSISEVEPNDTQATAQLLSAIERTNFVDAAINSPGDIDWYKFGTVSGRTYVVELFGASSGLSLKGNACQMYGDGVGIEIYSQASNKIAESCDAYGSGNVHNYLEFTSPTSGIYFVKIIPNNSSASGSYFLRILPKHGEPGADWDSTTHEPNNSKHTAYAIPIGHQNAIHSVIKQRDTANSTFTVDHDWYRFEAVAGKTYVVELFNVSVGLAGEGHECGSSYYDDGVGLRIYDYAGSHVVSKCDAYGAGNTHNYTSFTAGVSDTYYILVQPDSRTSAGTYSVRVLPKHDEPGADWDSTSHEPNNSKHNAYAIPIGHQNAIHSAIEQRDMANSTFTVDHDWYRFEAVAGRTYMVELFNVSVGLAGEGHECGSSYYDDGVGLRIYDYAGSHVVSKCDAYGAGNTHNYTSFTAGVSDTYYILVQPDSRTSAGTYSVRVLPKHDEPGAGWDSATLEPNNITWNAYSIRTGGEHALQSNIEQRNTAYSTFTVDHDYFRIEAIAGQKYVVELFGVGSGLFGQGRQCVGHYSGVGILIYDQAGNRVTYDCSGSENDFVHNSLSFVAGLNGTYYILIQPNSKASQGNYTVCVSDSTCMSKIYLPLVAR